MLKHIAAIALLALTTVACGDSPTETAPTTTSTTTYGGFDLTVVSGTHAQWTQRVTLPAGHWISADYLSCDEMRAISLGVGPCASATVRLEAGVMTFSGSVGGEFTDMIRVRWKATGQ